MAIREVALCCTFGIGMTRQKPFCEVPCNYQGSGFCKEMKEKTAGRTLPLLVHFLIGTPLEFLGTFLNIHKLMFANWLLVPNLVSFSARGERFHAIAVHD
jgi:hypothetical protein